MTPLATRGATTARTQPSASGLAAYLALGMVFGIVLVKSEVISWFRIQEMFRFQGFHMYGIILTAVLTAGISLSLLKRLGAKAITGDPIAVPRKTMGGGYRYWIGGTVFGLGWGLTGTCPGPMVALLGAGVSVMVVAILSALAGTWLYGYLRPRLPH